MTTTLTAAGNFRKSPFAPGFETFLNIVRLPRLWRLRQCSRRQLAYLLQVGPHLIADIGLTIEEAECEAGKAFWRS